MEAIGGAVLQADLDVPEMYPAAASLPEAPILGIDPGLTGALAFYWPGAAGRVLVEDMPVVGGEVDPHGIARLIRVYGPTRAMVEKVSAMPKNGSIACFKLGMAYGVARAAVAVAGVPLHLVPPTAWKKHFRLPGKGEGKEAGRRLAILRFPAQAERFSLKKDHGRADAALLALYAAEIAR